jgi:hypothetical protein
MPFGLKGPALRFPSVTPGQALDAAVIRAKVQMGFPERRTVFPSAPRAVNEPWTAVRDALTGERVYLHPVTGKLLLVRPPWRRPWGWAYALHMGLVFSVAAAADTGGASGHRAGGAGGFGGQRLLVGFWTEQAQAVIRSTQAGYVIREKTHGAHRLLRKARLRW